MTVKTAVIYTNGTTSVFDDKGEQIPELQVSLFELWFEHLEDSGVDPTKIEIRATINGADSIIKPIRVQGRWNYEIVRREQ